MKYNRNVDSERGIQTAITNYLQAKGYFVMRVNSGAIKTDKGYMVKLGQRGMPDLMAFTNKPRDTKIVGTWLVFIEVKTPTGKVTEAQMETMRELESHGAKCFVARSVDEVMKVL